jgi:hypothetical protein
MKKGFWDKYTTEFNDDDMEYFQAEIISCKKRTSWYKDMIGQTITIAAVMDTEPKKFFVIINDSYQGYLIDKDDIKIAG